MLEVENFLDEDLFTTFKDLAEKVNEFKFYCPKKLNFVVRKESDDTVNSLVKTRWGSSGDSPTETFHYLIELEESVQDKIFDALKELQKKYFHAYEDYGKKLTDNNFKIDTFQTDFQFLEADTLIGSHVHHKGVSSVIYVHPRESKGTIFDDKVVDWKPNKAIMFTQETHSFMNTSSSVKRVNINIFINQDDSSHKFLS